MQHTSKKQKFESDLEALEELKKKYPNQWSSFFYGEIMPEVFETRNLPVKPDEIIILFKKYLKDHQ